MTKTVTPEQVTQYRTGGCFALAQALSRITGYPQKIIDHGRLVHAFVMTPDGNFIDVHGKKTEEEFLDFLVKQGCLDASSVEQGYVRIEDFPSEIPILWRHAGYKPPSETAIKKAMPVAKIVAGGQRDVLSVARNVAVSVRKALELKHQYPDGSCRLNGACIEASELIVKRLSEVAVKARTVEGWCVYDDQNYGSSRPYDEHTWVEVDAERGTLFVDVTLDQFQPAMDDFIEPVVIGNVPQFLVLEEPRPLEFHRP
jgi:hypothetical protein